MSLLYGSLHLGFIYAVLAIGVYITFNVLDVPDLTAEGSFTLGLATSATCTVLGHPYLGLIAATVAGFLAGNLTGVFQTKLKIHPVLAGILTMSGLYSLNLLVMGGRANLSLIGGETVFKITQKTFENLDKDITNLFIPIGVVIFLVALLTLFFKTQIGLIIRATGDNAEMVKASSINVESTKILALGIGNGCIALSGGLISQYQGFADINSGIGIIVVGLASVIIGEALVGKRSIFIGLVSSVIGSIIYRFIIALALQYSPLPAYGLKFISACIVGIALSLPAIKYYIEFNKIKSGRYE